MKLDELKAQQHRFSLEMRALDRILESEEFSTLFHKLHGTEKESLILLCKMHEKDAVQKMLRDKTRERLEDLTYKDLRLLASQLKIYKYGCMSKARLVAKIEEHYENERRA